MKNGMKILLILFSVAIVTGVAFAQYDARTNMPIVFIQVNNDSTMVYPDDMIVTGETVFTNQVLENAIPVVGMLPAGEFDAVVLQLEGTSFQWWVTVDANGMFLTEFPYGAFPPGDYVVILNGTPVFNLRISE